MLQIQQPSGLRVVAPSCRGFCFRGKNPAILHKPRGTRTGARPAPGSESEPARPWAARQRCPVPDPVPGRGPWSVQPLPPGPPPSVAGGRTHQLGQEEGEGDGEEQRDPRGHVGRGVGGGWRQVPGSHAVTYCSAPYSSAARLLPQSSSYHLLPDTPIRRTDVAGEGKNRSRRAGPSTRSASRSPADGPAGGRQRGSF
jgi:hypothetical protein